MDDPFGQWGFFFFKLLLSVYLIIKLKSRFTLVNLKIINTLWHLYARHGIMEVSKAVFSLAS